MNELVGVCSAWVTCGLWRWSGSCTFYHLSSCCLCTAGPPGGSVGCLWPSASSSPSSFPLLPSCSFFLPLFFLPVFLIPPPPVPLPLPLPPRCWRCYDYVTQKCYYLNINCYGVHVVCLGIILVNEGGEEEGEGGWGKEEERVRKVEMDMREVWSEFLKGVKEKVKE